MTPDQLAVVERIRALKREKPSGRPQNPHLPSRIAAGEVLAGRMTIQAAADAHGVTYAAVYEHVKRARSRRR